MRLFITAVNPRIASTSTARMPTPIARPRSKTTIGAFCADGSKLMLMTDIAYSAPRIPFTSGGDGHAPALRGKIAHRKPCGDDERRTDVGQVIGREVSRVVRPLGQRIGDRHRQAELVAEKCVKIREPRRTAAEDHRFDDLAAETSPEIVERLVDLGDEFRERRRYD